MAFEDGPYLLSAVLCLGATRDKNGHVNLRGLMQEYHSPAPLGPALPRLVLVGVIYIAFAAGAAIGERRLTVVYQPAGEPDDTVVDERLMFLGGEQITSKSLNFTLGFHTPGVYWFRILLDGVMVTRVPLRVVAPEGTTAVQTLQA